MATALKNGCELLSRTISPLTERKWDELISQFDQSTVFHSQNWAKVLHRSYGYTPHYLEVISNDRSAGLIPIMEVNSVFTGRRGVSLTFSDYCQPLVSSEFNLCQLMPLLIDYGKSARWQFIDIRGKIAADATTPSVSFFLHQVHLNRPLDSIFRDFRHSTRTNIKKAQREDIQVEFTRSAEALEEYYRLTCINRKRNGVPPQPLQFFRNLHEIMIKGECGEIALVKHGKKNIAAAVFLFHNKTVLHKYLASDARYQGLRSNNLMVWEAMQRYHSKYDLYCFGRTDLSNQGLQRFKRGWGGQESVLNYHRVDLRSEALVSQKIEVSGISQKIFQRTPIPLLRLIGTLLYKHVG